MDRERALLPGETQDWTDDKGVVWTLQVVGNRIMSYIRLLEGQAMRWEKSPEGEATLTDIDPEKWIRRIYEMIKFGLVGVSGEVPAPFERVKVFKFGREMEIVSDKFMDALSPDMVMALNNQITALNTAGPGELKNSGSQRASEGSDSTAKPAPLSTDLSADASKTVSSPDAGPSVEKSSGVAPGQ